MINIFDTNNDNSFRRGVGSNQLSSPDQLSIVWSGADEVVAALPITGNVTGAYELDLVRFPAGFNLSAALKMRRAAHPNSLPITEQTHYLTIIPNFSERTRILALSGDVLALNDDELIEWLLSAENQITLGIDNHPVFETPLEETSCSIVRLPNGQVSMTEVPRRQINLIREKMRLLQGEEASSPSINLSIETSLRCTARYFLTALPEGADSLKDEKEREVTAFLLISQAGFSYGLWSPVMGLFSEYAFPAPAEINHLRSILAEKSARASREAATAETGDSRIIGQTFQIMPDAELEKLDNRPKELLEQYIRYAFEQLFLQLSQEKLDYLGLSSYSQLVWATENSLIEAVAPIAAEYTENTGLEFIQLEIPIEEAAATGLLFGSFTFGEATAAGAEIIPTVNMARDILVLADKEEIKRQQIEEAFLLKRHSRALFALFAAPIIVGACLLALTLNLLLNQAMLSMRESRADARTLELKPALDRRKSYEANLKWYQEFVGQVSRLRQQQPVGIGLLYELNTNYPFTIDPSFYVSDLKLLVNGEVQMKGLARNKDAVTSFLRALEFTGGRESGTKLFSNLAYEVQENVLPITAGNPANLPAISGSSFSNSNNITPGVIAWSIKGNYLPAVKFAPPDPTKSPSPAPTPATVVKEPTP